MVIIRPEASSTNNIKAFFIDCWKGKEKLWIAFWVGTLIFLLLDLVDLLVLMGVSSFFEGKAVNIFQVGYSWVSQILIGLPLSIWWLVSVWRCAHNTSLSLWTGLARAVVILAVVSVLFDVYVALEQYIF